jgi:hypothetical protein
MQTDELYVKMPFGNLFSIEILYEFFNSNRRGEHACSPATSHNFLFVAVGNGSKPFRHIAHRFVGAIHELPARMARFRAKCAGADASSSRFS